MKTALPFRFVSWLFLLPLASGFWSVGFAQTTPVKLTVRGSWPAWPSVYPGEALTVADHFLYVSGGGGMSGVGPGFQVFDVANPAQPVQVGSVALDGGFLQMQVVSNLAYIGFTIEGTSSGLYVYDVQNPSQPRRMGVGTRSLKDGVRAVHVVGQYAYLGTQHGLEVFDVGDAANPRSVGRWIEPDASYWRLQVQGDYAYVACDAGLAVLDVSNPAQPNKVAEYNTGRALGISVVGGYAYLASNGGGLQIIDIHTPTQPVFTGSYVTAGGHDLTSVKVLGQYAYVTADFLAGDNKLRSFLEVIDVKNPALPARVGTFTSSRGYYLGFGVDVLAGRAYCPVRDIGFEIIDVSNRQSPAQLSRVRTVCGIDGATVANGYAYVIDSAGDYYDSEFVVLDVQDSSKPSPLGKLVLTGWGGARLCVAGDYAYLAGRQADASEFGLLIIDIRNPARPVLAGTLMLPSPYYAGSLCARGQYVYLGVGASLGLPEEQRRGLWIVNVGNPAQPAVVGTFEDPVQVMYPEAVQVSGNFAYLATDGRGGLRIIDVSVPANPVLVGSYREGTYQNFSSLALGFPYAYLWAGEIEGVWGVLEIVDVSNPAQPAKLGSLVTGGSSGSLVVNGGYASVITWGVAGFLVMDVSTPAAPAIVAQDPNLLGYDVGTLGSDVYLAGGPDGFVILKMSLDSSLKVSLGSDNRVGLSWAGGPRIKLQKTASLTAPNWQDVPGSEGASQIELPRSAAAAFFRLIQP